MPANLGAGAVQAATRIEANPAAADTALQSVSAEQLAAAMAAGAVNILDVRTPGEFDTVKIAGSVNMALDRLDAAALIARFGAETPLYCICQTGTRSQIAASKLRAGGLRQVIQVDGGTNAWVAAGYAVESGARKVMSLDRQMRITAGALVVTGIAGGALVHPAAYGLAAVIGAGLVYAGLSNSCGMTVVLAKMPWNR